MSGANPQTEPDGDSRPNKKPRITPKELPPALYEAIVQEPEEPEEPSSSKPADREVIEKVRQCTNPQNMSEAEVGDAFRRAIRIMAIYNIKRVDTLCCSTRAEEMGSAGECAVLIKYVHKREQTVKRIEYFQDLAFAVTTHFNVKSTWTSRSKSMERKFYGIRPNAIAAAMTYAMLFNVLSELARTQKTISQKNSYCKGHAENLKRMAKKEYHDELLRLEQAEYQGRVEALKPVQRKEPAQREEQDQCEEEDQCRSDQSELVELNRREFDAMRRDELVLFGAVIDLDDSEDGMPGPRHNIRYENRNGVEIISISSDTEPEELQQSPDREGIRYENRDGVDIISIPSEADSEHLYDPPIDIEDTSGGLSDPLPNEAPLTGIMAPGAEDGTHQAGYDGTRKFIHIDDEIDYILQSCTTRSNDERQAALFAHTFEQPVENTQPDMGPDTQQTQLEEEEEVEEMKWESLQQLTRFCEVAEDIAVEYMMRKEISTKESKRLTAKFDMKAWTEGQKDSRKIDDRVVTLDEDDADDESESADADDENESAQD
ncbi:uncharacterized protein K452DRAFT_294617 [Aplosporella prunicola CBS 121167]|uniref:DUF7168 domain-containing protein n=1 Tax=Aplosporella prunicola CBS 121167 TaxID=1176127 RepID=A0A6A6BRT6_9PEZI|nr:uncharacterized protein K452DRAFT_294617 [Aplosporella prunicola CBS 121167]KAF2146005.1 hypothetical protein K452DRAFT_294617 [Aplosporella prunicola CBS 121167]